MTKLSLLPGDNIAKECKNAGQSIPNVIGIGEERETTIQYHMADHMKPAFDHHNLSATSPIGNRSPQVASNIPRQDSSGTLKTTIFLGTRNPIVVQKGPFYLLKDLPEPPEVNGSMNLITHHGLQTAYAKYCGKKMKEDLSSTLSLPGNINLSGNDDNSSLRGLIEKPPITGKELHLLSSSQLTGFRLHPGQLPEQHRLFAPQKRKLKKKSKPEPEITPSAPPPTPPVEPEVKRNKEKRKEKKAKKEKKKKRQKKDGD